MRGRGLRAFSLGETLQLGESFALGCFAFDSRSAYSVPASLTRKKRELGVIGGLDRVLTARLHLRVFSLPTCWEGEGGTEKRRE